MSSSVRTVGTARLRVARHHATTITREVPTPFAFYRPDHHKGSEGLSAKGGAASWPIRIGSTAMVNGGDFSRQSASRGFDESGGASLAVG